MKKVVQWLFHSFGFHITRIRKRTTRRTLTDALEHIAKLSQEIGFDPPTVIDVGAADGTYELYRSFPKSRFLLIEPLREFEDSLKAICQQYDATYVIAAASNREGTTTINISPDLYGSSILTPKEPHVDFKKREVPTVTLDRLVAERGLKGPFVLKVDAQSAELRVLGGASTTVPESEVVILETQLFQFVEDGPQLFDVVSLLKQKGFVVYDIVGHSYRPLDGALMEVDIIFVKEKGLFRASHRFAHAEQCEKQLAQSEKRP